MPGRRRLRRYLHGQGDAGLPDPASPTYDFLPAGADADAFDTANGTDSDIYDAESHLTTRYLQLPAGTSGCVVIVELSVATTGITFIVDHPVLTIDVATPTAT